MPVDRARSATRSIGGAVARPTGSPINAISPVRSKNTTRAAAAPYVITDTGQTVSSGSGISPIPQDMEIVPRNLAQGAMMRSGSAPAGGTQMIVDEGGPGPSGASHSWTVLNQQNNTYDERQEHFHEHHQHEHMHDNRFVNVDTHEHLHDNRSVGVTVQQISMDPVIIAEATEAVAQARAHEQHVTASAEAAVAQARSNEQQANSLTEATRVQAQREVENAAAQASQQFAQVNSQAELRVASVTRQAKQHVEKLQQAAGRDNSGQQAIIAQLRREQTLALADNERLRASAAAIAVRERESNAARQVATTACSKAQQTVAEHVKQLNALRRQASQHAKVPRTPRSTTAGIGTKEGQGGTSPFLQGPDATAPSGAIKSTRSVSRKRSIAPRKGARRIISREAIRSPSILKRRAVVSTPVQGETQPEADLRSTGCGEETKDTHTSILC